MDGAELIKQERERQINGEGYMPEHDLTHRNMELTSAAMAYLYAAGSAPPFLAFATWPWSKEYFKPSGFPATDPVRDLVKAGALIAAEIDRIQAMRK